MNLSLVKYEAWDKSRRFNIRSLRRCRENEALGTMAYLEIMAKLLAGLNLESSKLPNTPHKAI